MSTSAGAVPLTLRASTWIVTVQALLAMVLVLLSDRFPAPGRSLLAACLALGVVFARRAARLRPGSALGVLMFELSMVLVALGAGGWPMGARVALATSAVAAVALLLASLHAFPAPEVPVR